MDSLPDKDLSCVNDFVSVVNAVTAQVGLGLSLAVRSRTPSLSGCCNSFVAPRVGGSNERKSNVEWLMSSLVALVLQPAL